MTTTTVYASETDGNIQSSDATYLTARSGASLVEDAAGNLTIGQFLTGGVYYCREALAWFDTGTPIPDTDTVSAATVSLWGVADTTTQDFTVEARIHSWSSGNLTTADWVAGADLSGKTKVATFASAGWSITGYNNFTSEAAFPGAISKTALTELLFNSDRHEAGTAPDADFENLAGEDANNVGTDHDPKLVVEHAGFGPPTGLTATAISDTQIDLEWNAAPEAMGYDVDRDAGLIVENTSLLTYSDTGLDANTEYTYRVRSRKW